MIDYTGMARHGLHIRHFADALAEHVPGEVAAAMQRRARLHVEATFMREEETKPIWEEISRIEKEIRSGSTTAHRLALTFFDLETLLEDDTAQDDPSQALSALVRRTLENLPALASAPERPGRMTRAA